MAKQVFRQKSVERISSPEELNDYLKVTNPSVWMVLAAVIVLLIGFFVWGFAGSLKTTVPGIAVVENGQAAITLSRTSPKEITPEMKVTVGGKEGALLQAAEPDELAAAVDLPDGTYQAEVTVEDIHPISFLLG